MLNLTDSEDLKPDEDDEIVEQREQSEEKVDFVTPEEAAKTAQADAPEAANRNQSEKAKKSAKSATAVGPKGNKFKRFFADYWAKKKWTIPVTILAIVAILMAVPYTRYAILGPFMKSQVQVTVVDSKTGKAVSSATVTLKGQTFKTDGRGIAAGKVGIGYSTLSVEKQYYTSANHDVTVTISSSHNNFKISLVAVGRQVPIKVINKITGKPLDGVTIKVLNTEAKTDKNGAATIVLPTTQATQTATVALAGYNTLTAQVQVTDQVVAANTFSLTPAGKLYFLSNQTGKIDVVKTNLDGTDRQIVLAGTGSEDLNSTSLLASRDWKYLALLSRRAGDSASVYIIDTSNDKLTAIDSGTATFGFIGWSDDSFVYQVYRTGYQNWQPKAQALKSYDATSGKIAIIDETNAQGTSSYDYAFQTFSNVYILKNELLYIKNWSSGYYGQHLGGKTADLVSVKPDATGKKTVKAFPIPDGSQYSAVNLSLYEPYGVYVQVPTDSSNSAHTYYEYEDGALTAKPSLSDDDFNKPYPTYLISPSDNYTLWTDQRDGKNALFVGDDEGDNAKQIANLSEYTQYGWYTDNYILVSKSSSELYIMPADGSGAPQKITDYYKPPISYRGYGGGYGGV